MQKNNRVSQRTGGLLAPASTPKGYRAEKNHRAVLFANTALVKQSLKENDIYRKITGLPVLVTPDEDDFIMVKTALNNNLLFEQSAHLADTLANLKNSIAEDWDDVLIVSDSPNSNSRIEINEYEDVRTYWIKFYSISQECIYKKEIIQLISMLNTMGWTLDNPVLCHVPEIYDEECAEEEEEKDIYRTITTAYQEFEQEVEIVAILLNKTKINIKRLEKLSLQCSDLGLFTQIILYLKRNCFCIFDYACSGDDYPEGLFIESAFRIDVGMEKCLYEEYEHYEQQGYQPAVFRSIMFEDGRPSVNTKEQKNLFYLAEILGFFDFTTLKFLWNELSESHLQHLTSVVPIHFRRSFTPVFGNEHCERRTGFISYSVRKILSVSIGEVNDRG